MNVTMTNSLWLGGNIVTVPKFEPTTFLNIMEKHKPSYLHLAPPLVGFLATHPAVKKEHMENLDSIMVGAAPAGQALIDLFHKRAPHVRFREGYGMTEMSPAVTFPRLSVVSTGGSSGQLLPNTSMKVVDLVTGE